MPMVEDLRAFLNDSEFATEALWSEATDPVTVIFDNAFIENLEITGSLPNALGIESDFPGVEQGQTLTINSVTYNIVTPEPDGTGFVRLIMEKAA
jgi:hypothetical protein